MLMPQSITMPALVILPILGVGVQLAGGVKIGAWAWLQAGCSAGYRVVVGDGVVCAPGTVLQADVSVAV